jgi:hypothetical protein
MTDDLLDAIEAAVLEGSLMELNDTMRQQTGQGLLEHVGETDLLDALVALTDEEEALAYFEPLASAASPMSAPGGCGS